MRERYWYDEMVAHSPPALGNRHCRAAAEGDELHIVCSYADIDPGEVFDGMCELKIFTWFNWGFPFGEPINVRSFEPKVNA